MSYLVYYYYCVCVCVIVENFVGAHYTQQWAVHIEGGSQVADEVARDHGFSNQGQVKILSFSNTCL